LENDFLKMKTEAFVIEKTFDAPVERVWKAITDKKEMKHWYFDLVEFEPQVGFEFQFEGKGKKGEEYIHLCKITEVLTLQKLSYSWSYKDVKGMSLVTFELFPDGNKTNLKLTHAGLETFPIGNPDFARESFAGGWSHIIGINLQNFLKK
jgi:uncharacterized protein YndB with AHSA1/START domain